MVVVIRCVLVDFQAHLLREADNIAIDLRSATDAVADAGGKVVPVNEALIHAA